MSSPEADPTTALCDRLEQLRGDGTAGRWQLDGADNVFVEYRHKGDLYTDGIVSAAYTTSADAALITAAVNAIPELIAVVRRQAAALHAVEALAVELDGCPAEYWTGGYQAAAQRIRTALAAAAGQ